MVKFLTCVGALLLLGVFLPADAWPHIFGPRFGTCKCNIVNHPQWFCCNSNAAIVAKFISKSTEVATHYRNKEVIVYQIEITKVLHGEEELKDLTLIISEKRGNKCVYEHPADGYGIDYAIAGDYQDGTYKVDACTCIKKWSDLTPSQVEGAEGVYSLGCDCEITTCHGAPCKQNKNTCPLEEYIGGDSENQEQNQICRKSPDGKTCIWQNIL